MIAFYTIFYVMDNAIRKQIEAKLYPQPGVKPVKEQFLKIDDVNEKSNEIKEIQDVLDALSPNMDKENDLNVSIDDEFDLTI